MLRSASAVLALALAAFACGKDPVLGADVDLSSPATTSSKPFLSASASASASALVPASSPPPPPDSASSPATLARPAMTQQLLTGFPACVPDPPPRPPELIPNCQQVGNRLCLRNTERTRSIGDDDYIALELRPLLTACVRPSLLPSSVTWVTIGVLPSGQICAPRFRSSERLKPQSLACAARTLHAYRAPVADRSSDLMFKVAFPAGAPVVLRPKPAQ